MKGDESREQIKSREEVWDKAFMDMCKALDKFGPGEILNLLEVNSRRDAVIHQLLLTYPQVVALGDFIASLPTFKPPKQRRRRNPKRRVIS